MKTLIKILRAVLFVALSTGLYFLLLLAVGILKNQIIDFFNGSVEYAKWIGATLVLGIVGIPVFGFLSLPISRINPFHAQEKLILIPFVIGMILYFWRYIAQSLQNIDGHIDPFTIPKLCMILLFLFMSVRLFFMVNRDPFGD